MLCVLIRGDSNEYTQYTIFNIKITQNHPKFAVRGFCSKGLKNEFETAVVNEPSLLEPLKIYWTDLHVFLFACLEEVLFDMEITLKGKKCSKRSKFFLFRVDPF